MDVDSPGRSLPPLALPTRSPLTPPASPCLPACLPACLPGCAEDRKARELIDTKNQADSMVYQTEKQVGARMLLRAGCWVLVGGLRAADLPAGGQAGRQAVAGSRQQGAILLHALQPSPPTCLPARLPPPTHLQVKEFADKVPEDVKAAVEAKNAALKEAIPSDDVARVGAS